MDIDTFSNRCTPASTDLSICIWLCVFSIVYNYFNVGGRINIRMNTYGIFFVRNIRKRVAASRRNIAGYDFLLAFAEQMFIVGFLQIFAKKKDPVGSYIQNVC